jgi:hypothetical protein
MGFGFGFDLFGILFFLAFLLFFGVFAFMIAKSIGQWNKNNHSPRLTVAATVIAKRTNVSHHHSSGHHHHSTTYHVTFQVESGDRMELMLNGNEYGLLVEGDRGMLSLQGTRYLGFVRT